MSEFEPVSFTAYNNGKILSQGDFNEYWDFQHGAFAVHLDREQIRRGLWKQYPALDQFNQIKVKVDRVINSLKLGDELQSAIVQNIVEESYDIVNYANFGARIVQGRV
jgi:hypothetical protein